MSHSNKNTFHQTITYYGVTAQNTLLRTSSLNTQHAASAVSSPTVDITEHEHHALHIEKPLGRGGMGTVFQAQQYTPKRSVAVKRLHDHNQHLKAALIREAMIGGALEHPSIIPIYEVRLDSPHAPEVIMKKIEGHSLKKFCTQKNTLTEAIKALIQVCHALEYAHANGVFHRDIKPENIMLDAFASVYLVDWGLAISKDIVDQLPVHREGTPRTRPVAPPRRGRRASRP